jgi:hypothetical protein
VQGAGDFAVVSVIFGREGKGFPWRSALNYQLSIPQPSTCQYVEYSLFGTQFNGQVPAAHSPVAFEGTPVELLLDALLGVPTQDVDFDLSCTSLQKGDARNPGPSPDKPSPDKFEWIKPKRPTARIAEFEDAFLAHWQGDGDGSSNNIRRPLWHHQQFKTSDETDHDYSRRAVDDRSYHSQRHDASYAPVPAQPPPSSSLEARDAGYLFITLSPNDINLNGSFTQPASTNWGECGSGHFLPLCVAAP